MKSEIGIPEFIYGTAWKEDRTAELTMAAVTAGFKAIDTANQKKHYREDYVGEALLELYRKGLKRESFFLQTKFTYVNGQDHRLPYDPNDDFSTQVKSSFENSLKNLHTDYIDSFLLHGPSTGGELTEADWEVWASIEALYQAGRAKMIGVSNFAIHQIKELVKGAKVKPMFVQNRCYANRGWDKAVREFCITNKIIYQGFSLLTANPQIVKAPEVLKMAQRFGVEPQQVIFRFAKQIGILPLTGTTNKKHMSGDLLISRIELSQEELNLLSSLR